MPGVGGDAGSCDGLLAIINYRHAYCKGKSMGTLSSVKHKDMELLFNIHNYI